jgi:hypothetical protein
LFSSSSCCLVNKNLPHSKWPGQSSDKGIDDEDHQLAWKNRDQSVSIILWGRNEN